MGSSARGPTICRHCGSVVLTHLGRLPDGENFAGRRLSPPLPGGSLYACRKCDFVFRSPVVPDTELMKLYSGGKSDVWVNDYRRVDFEMVLQEIGSDSSSVLDVGCYTGDLLAALPSTCSRFGVEPNKAAAAIARERSIEIVGSNVDQVLAQSLTFDVVVACDVIEHVSIPAAFLDQLARLLKPDGRLILTTGNPEAPLWRVCKSRFWYCYFPEHISFVSRKWLTRVAKNCGLTLSNAKNFNYLANPAFSLRALRQVAEALAYAALPQAYRRLSVLLRRRAAGAEQAAFGPPGCGGTEDHVLFVLSRSV